MEQGAPYIELLLSRLHGGERCSSLARATAVLLSRLHGGELSTISQTHFQINYLRSLLSKTNHSLSPHKSLFLHNYSAKAD